MEKQSKEADKLWTKHIDSRYIAGEDLYGSINGLRPEMGVYMFDAVEGETYDQNAQKKEVKWILHFKDIDDNKPLYKGIVANKGTKDVFHLMTGTNRIQDAYGMPIIVYAQADRRHGYVVRFKPYKIPKELMAEVSVLRDCKTLGDLEKAYKGLDSVWQNNIIIKQEAQALKNKLK